MTNEEVIKGLMCGQYVSGCRVLIRECEVTLDVGVTQPTTKIKIYQTNIKGLAQFQYVLSQHVDGVHPDISTAGETESEALILAKKTIDGEIQMAKMQGIEPHAISFEQNPNF